MIKYDELMENLPSKPVIDAIEKVSSSSSSGKVIASDVATMAGVSLSQARKDLTAMASLTQGDIAVTSDGELMYSFPPNVRAVLASNNAKYRFQSLWKEKIWPPLFYGIRVSFGLVLLVSIFAIFTTLMFVSSGSRSDDDRRDRGGGFGGGMSFGYNPFWGPSPFDFFYYRPYYSRYDAPRMAGEEEEMGFLESTFSYIFGDGNPNNDVERKSLSMIANFIREKNGAVTAEQLAPFLTDVPSPPSAEDDEQAAYVDESFVLPVVTKLNGEPRVTDDGDIVYVFPELQISAASAPSKDTNNGALILSQLGIDPDIPTIQLKQIMYRLGIDTRGALQRRDLISILTKYFSATLLHEQQDTTLLQEQEYKFTLASDFQRILAGALGVLNLGGALYLGNYLSTLAIYGIRLPAYYGLVQSFYPFFLAYAVLFNLIPLARSFWIAKLNSQIQTRNRNRRLWKDKLEKGGRRLQKKLASAFKMGSDLKLLGTSKRDIVYDTTMKKEDIEKQKVKSDLTDFDKRLNLD